MARIAAIGLIEHNTIVYLDRFPEPGLSTVVSNITEAAGGTATSTALALARLGEHVTLGGLVGNDSQGVSARGDLEAAGIDCGTVTIANELTAASIILLETETGERTVLRREGAAIRKGDQLDIAALFGHDVVILDTPDVPLQRFLTDLPAHTRPDVRLLGPLTCIVDNEEGDAEDIAFRFDAIVGTVDQLSRLMHAGTLDTLIECVQAKMPGTNLRAAVVTLGAEGCLWITPAEHGRVPGPTVDAVTTTGAGDAFTAGIAYGMARRWPWTDTTRFADAVRTLSARALVCHAALPTLDEINHLLDEQT